jgi:hypothetical protein
MLPSENIKKKIVSLAKKNTFFLPHATKQMSRSERMIATDEIRDAVLHGEIIEEYSDEKKGESFLIHHTGQNSAIHVVCAPKIEYLAVITAYKPAPDQWSSDFKVRK